MSSSSDGWGRLAGISDADIRGLDEEAVDEYYVFLLTNKLSSEELLTNDPLKLTKLVNNIQTVVRVSSLSLSLSHCLFVSLKHLVCVCIIVCTTSQGMGMYLLHFVAMATGMSPHYVFSSS